MFTELIDMLRCPNAHEDSWLVATSTRSAERHILDGVLGCPVCRASFAIEDGEARFGTARRDGEAPPFDEDTAFRLAAQLHLLEAPQPILVTGEWSRAIPALLRIIAHVKVFVGDTHLTLPLDERVSTLTLPAAGLPLATGALRGLALDAAHVSAPLLGAAARVVRTKGRLVVPAGTALDLSDWTPLASDAHHTVAERLPSASAPIPLRRAPSSPLFDA